MRLATVTDLRRNPSRWIRYVKAGETVVILRRGEYAGHLEPPVLSDEDRLRRLEQLGIVRRAKRPLPPGWIRKIKPIPCGADAVAILIEQRRSSFE